MNGAYRIWLGSKGDSADLARLHALAFSEAWPTPAFSSLLEREGVAVFLGSRATSAEAEGFILVRATADEAEVLTFCVEERVRRAGLGHALLDAAGQFLQARGTVKMLLEVSEDNVSALALYRKFGFLTVGRRAAYYRHGLQASDALVMKKLLNTEALPPTTRMDYTGL